MEKLQQWLEERCKEHNLTWREASIKAGLNPGSFSGIFGGQKPGLETCKKIAKLFRVSTVLVLQMAGHLENFPPPSNSLALSDERLRALVEDWPDLAENRRNAIDAMRRTWKEHP